eukprot:COSAG04_NODE_14770_length_555_cov_17.877193_1_plen_62_part_10
MTPLGLFGSFLAFFFFVSFLGAFFFLVTFFSMFTFMTRAEVLLPMVNGYDDVQWYMSTWTGV